MQLHSKVSLSLAPSFNIGKVGLARVVAGVGCRAHAVAVFGLRLVSVDISRQYLVAMWPLLIGILVCKLLILESDFVKLIG